MILALIGILLSLLAAGPARAATALRLIQTIPLEQVEGRIDHMAADADGQRLFVAALGNNTVEVIDLRRGKRIKSLEGYQEPQGVGFAPGSNRLFVANGGSGRCDIIDAASYGRLRTAKFESDADNVRCDAASKKVYIGYGNGALGILDAQSGDSVGSIPLPGHPESFQLEASGHRIFVNVPSVSQVVVVDRSQGRVVASWPLGSDTANYPMALDETGHRLFVGCRHPAEALIYDTRSGKRLGAIPTCGDADDLFYDAVRGRLYVSCGAGVLDVFADKQGDLVRVARIPTAKGARTSLYIPALNRLYLAVPHRGSQRSELRVFEAQSG